MGDHNGSCRQKISSNEIDDADEASDLFEQLMGDNVENREFIEANVILLGI